MTQLLVISDTHYEFHTSASEREEMLGLPNEGVDALLLAGDITSYKLVGKTADILCDRFPQVLWVTGNHEYYGGSKERVDDAFADAEARHPNLKRLYRTTAEVAGLTFAGTTLWWGPHPDNPTKDDIILAKSIMSGFVQGIGVNIDNRMSPIKLFSDIASRAINDMFQVKGIFDWVYDEHERDVAFVRGQVGKADGIVTHLAPSWESVALKYKTDPRSRYYVVDLHRDIQGANPAPALWVHGHTHVPQDYRIGRTRVLCSPRGYPREKAGPVTGKLVDVERST